MDGKHVHVVINIGGQVHVLYVIQMQKTGADSDFNKRSRCSKKIMRPLYG